MPDLDPDADRSDRGLPDSADAGSSGGSTREPGDILDDEPAPGDAPADGGAAAKGRRRPRPGRAAALVAAVLAGVVLGAGGMAVLGAPGKAPAAAPSPSASAPGASPEAGSASIVVDGPTVGSSTALVTVEIWADYQCPYCRLESAAFGGAMERELALSGKVKVTWRDFAFLGQESRDAAVAARCAGKQSPTAYWRYHDLLFVQQQGENQGAFSRSNLQALAVAASLDSTAFTACLDDPVEAQAVSDETAQGRTLGITSTPTIRVIGPGGERLLKGFSSSWTTVPGAVDAVSSAAPSGAPAATGSPVPGASASAGPSASAEPSPPSASASPSP